MSDFFKMFFYFFAIVIILTLFIACSSAQVISISNQNQSNFNGEFIWPLPGYSYISSYFGSRNSPTAGASSYHSGIDIPAKEGTNILSVCSGIVTFASWGAGRWIYNCSKK